MWISVFKTQEHLKVKPNFYFSEQGCILSQTSNAHKGICACIFRSRVFDNQNYISNFMTNV